MAKAGLAVSQGQVYQANGCTACHGTGYRGRTVISELLIPDENVRKLIVGRASAAQIQVAATAQGMETLRNNGLRKVLDGTTSIDEVSRVAQVEE